MKNKEVIHKKLERIRKKIAEMKATEKEAEDEFRAAEDAEKLDIIHKTGMTPEQLIFYNGLKREEIEMILERRKERVNVQKDNRDE